MTDKKEYVMKEEFTRERDSTTYLIIFGIMFSMFIGIMLAGAVDVNSSGIRELRSFIGEEYNFSEADCKIPIYSYRQRRESPEGCITYLISGEKGRASPDFNETKPNACLFEKFGTRCQMYCDNLTGRCVTAERVRQARQLLGGGNK